MKKHITFLLRLAIGCLIALAAHPMGHAQQSSSTPLAHPLRTLNAADEDFRDLDFLRAEIGTARVVMLGEPTHGEGNVFQVKTRLVNYLQQQLGFTVLAFESGLYEMHKAQELREKGVPIQQVLDNSLFPVWTGAAEFQGMVNLLAHQKLRLAGFDSQLTGAYSDELLDDIQTFLGSQQQLDVPTYAFVDEIITSMDATYAFPTSGDFPRFARVMASLERKLAHVAQIQPARQAQANFLAQCLRSLTAQAKDYTTRGSGQLSQADFRAVDSNARDRQMAENLLFLLRTHPQDKFICWGANTHFANQVNELGSEELRAFRPMGSYLKAALGNQVYVLATAAGGGQHGILGSIAKEVPIPPPGSLEAQLTATGVGNVLVGLHQAWGKEVHTTSILEYTPLTGRWGQVFDGLLFLPLVTGVTPRLVGQSSPQDSLPLSARTISPRSSPPAVFTQAVTVPRLTDRHGIVRDAATGVGLPFASVLVAGKGSGVTTDINGRFSVPALGARDSLEARCLGYQPVRVLASSYGETLIRLSAQQYKLAEVTVRAIPITALGVLTAAIRTIPQHAMQTAYNAQAYARISFVRNDSVLCDVEAVNALYVPASPGPCQYMPREVVWHRSYPPNDKKVLTHVKLTSSLARLDPLASNPIFEQQRLKHFDLTLEPSIEYGGERVYVVAFRALRTGPRFTGGYYDQAYSGRLYINEHDYAVMRGEFVWGRDTSALRKLGQRARTTSPTQAALNNVYAYNTIHQTVVYSRQDGGHYALSATMVENLEKGISATTGTSFEERIARTVVLSEVTTQHVAPITTPPLAFDWQVIPFHELFWRSYRRPPVPNLE